MGAGRSVVCEVLPSKDQLLAALRGHYLLGPLCTQAFDLAELHRQRRERPECAAEIDSRRDELRGQIDGWARVTLPVPRPGAPTVAETLGVTIDRMAAASALAFHLLMTIDPAGNEMHAAWTRLAELEIAYGELSFGLIAGYRRLPEADCGAR
ncbi:hypothetical protein [Nocardia arizonensis]|uniref:hypothetical protein n=1 Tax=Nocardia arizonensis TaxID=1141647 RepID=UPI000A478D96|nr:hypothetical protein [Nocardia arizonensis]